MSQVFDFPYDRRFTREQITEITARAEEIADAFRDGVAPNGMILNVPEHMLQLWAVHAALAGVYVDPERAYIVARKLPDQPGRFEGSVEWILKEDAETISAEDAVESEAKTYADAIETKLTPEVRAALIKKLKEGE
jgi:hypothetical protein